MRHKKAKDIHVWNMHDESLRVPESHPEHQKLQIFACSAHIHNNNILYETENVLIYISKGIRNFLKHEQITYRKACGKKFSFFKIILM